MSTSAQSNSVRPAPYMPEPKFIESNGLRMAVYELTMLGDDTPSAVVIDEAIEIAKKFGSEGSGTFINGVLDSIRLRFEEPDRG